MGIETLAIVAIAATVAGAGLSAYSSIEAGKSQEALGRYNQAVMNNEALQRQQDARSAANAQRAQNEALKAKQRALYAKAGVVSAGTPLLVQAEQAATLEMAALDIERTGNIEAGRMRAQGDLDRMEGKIARRGANMQAVGTILQGGAAVAGMGASYRYQGIV
jgi:hypothetical protein